MLHVRVRSHRFYVPVGSVVDETINYSETALVTDLIHEFYYRKIGKNYDVLDNGYAEERRGRFVNVDGKPVEISFASSDPLIMSVSRVRDTADKLTFKKPGSVQLIVEFGGAVLARIPLELVVSPVRVGLSNQELLTAVGFPADEVTGHASWPRGWSLNRKSYNPTAAQRGISIKHLRYSEYPELVVGVDREGRVRSIHSNTEHARKR